MAIQQLSMKEVEQVSGGCCLLDLFAACLGSLFGACAPAKPVCGTPTPPPVVVPPTNGGTT
jgi:hypothetical protein